MYVYFFVLFFVTWAAYLARKSGNAFLSKIYLGLAFLVMVCVAGFRSSFVGTDTGGYVDVFNLAKSFQEIMYTSTGKFNYEYGYVLLSWLLHLISDDYIILLVGIAVIVVGCYQYAISKHSYKIEISFFAFIAMGFYTFFFNGARQGIGCAIYALAIGPLMDRKLFKYILCVLLASLFHKSAIIAIPFYFILDKNNSFRKNAVIFLGTCIVAPFLGNLTDMAITLDSKYAYIKDSGRGGGYYYIAFICMLCMFFLIFKRWVLVYREPYNLFLNMLIIGTIVSLISSIYHLSPSGFLRLNLYFNIGTVFLWPIVFLNLKNPMLKISYYFIFFGGYSLYFYLTTNRFSNLIPYLFNPNAPFVGYFR